MTMPSIVSKTHDIVVIFCNNHQDFVDGLMICDEFQHWLPGCAGGACHVAGNAYDKQQLREYLQVMPVDIECFVLTANVIDMIG
jgi:hypothetical protein